MYKYKNIEYSYIYEFKNTGNNYLCIIIIKSIEFFTKLYRFKLQFLY